jgi:hypothetical protein
MTRKTIAIIAAGVVLATALTAGVVLGPRSRTDARPTGLASVQKTPVPANSDGGNPRLPDPAVLRTLGAEEAVVLANAWQSEYPMVSTVLTSTEVVFQYPDGRTYQVPLPEDRMAVSIAPFISRTHPCITHSISGCQGELVGHEFAVRVTSADGVIFEGTVATQANGFFELWLPRDGTYAVQIAGLERVAVGELSTFATSQTCLTEFQLL